MGHFTPLWFQSMNKASFSTGTLEAPHRFSLALLDSPVLTDDNIVRRMKIFRIGTFADSLGRVNTWTQADLQGMVDNFVNLRQRGILPNVPVRLDHSISIKDVIGWFQNIYLDPAEPGFLFADIEFTEPDAKAKYERKTLRNRSIEIGRYESNEGEMFEPTVLGLAFVDLPAVEGLYRSPNAPTSAHSATGDQSPASGSAPNPQGDPVTTNKEVVPPGGTPPAPTTAPPAGSPPTNPAPTPADGAGDGNNFQRSPGAFAFRINDVETSDYSAVQAHIALLETFRTETMQATRSNFVNELAAQGKITNPMKEVFEPMVLTMSPTQFEAFAKGYATAPVQPILAKVPTGEGGTPPPAGSSDGAISELDTLREIVAQHRRAGKSEEEIARTASFKRLVILEAAKS